MLLLSFVSATAAAAAGSISLPYSGAYPEEYLRGGTFPPGFVWGFGTASYQIEGAWNEGGRGRSIWDTFSGAGGKTPNVGHEVIGDTGDVACDHYHRYREDVSLMASLGVKNYRFSIAWPRLLPNGTLSGGVNQAGVDFYNGLINELINHGIEPFVTLYHWDLPETLQTAEMPGWLDRRLIPLFEQYARLCFRLFGDRVKYWTTFNEVPLPLPVRQSLPLHPPPHRFPHHPALPSALDLHCAWLRHWLQSARQTVHRYRHIPL